MNRNEIGYWTCAALTCACAVLPFLSPKWFGDAFPRIVIFAYPILWTVFFAGASLFAKQSGRPRWWLLLTAPFAFWYLAELAAMILFGLVGGF